VVVCFCMNPLWCIAIPERVARPVGCPKFMNYLADEKGEM
jgi:hypothetical protein